MKKNIPDMKVKLGRLVLANPVISADQFKILLIKLQNLNYLQDNKHMIYVHFPPNSRENLEKSYRNLISLYFNILNEFGNTMISSVITSPESRSTYDFDKTA